MLRQPSACLATPHGEGCSRADFIVPGASPPLLPGPDPPTGVPLRHTCGRETMRPCEPSRTPGQEVNAVEANGPGKKLGPFLIHVPVEGVLFLVVPACLPTLPHFPRGKSTYLNICTGTPNRIGSQSLPICTGCVLCRFSPR